MDNLKTCPMCGQIHKVVDDEWGTIYCCNEKNFNLYERLFYKIDNVTKERWMNAIYNYLEKSPFKEKAGYNYYWKFFYEKTDKTPEDDCKVNLYHLMKQYPYQVIDRIDRILLNLSIKYPALSDTFYIGDFAGKRARLLYCESEEKRAELISIFSILQEQKYIEIVIKKQDDNSTYRLTYKGWQRIAQLSKNNNVIKQGFIAMSFDVEVEYIQSIFKQAIRQAGYEPQIIKDKEHNNYIMPEIFHEIETSKFVVVDITKQNYGAYYEAGYAQGLGKEVIVCCKKDVFDNPNTRPHFDIAQKSMILWTDEQDLLSRLVRRINATVK
jgi:nucleoside 2-deoxyribosyltransferase